MNPISREQPPNVPSGSHGSGRTRLSAEEVARAAGISVATLEHLVGLGLVETMESEGEYTIATVARLKRMIRLHRDLGVSLFGATIIVDLLERLDRMDEELSHLRRER